MKKQKIAASVAAVLVLLILCLSVFGGSAFADAQKSAVWPASSDESGAKPGGTVIGGIEKWSAAASARSAGSVIDRISSIDRRAAGFIR